MIYILVLFLLIFYGGAWLIFGKPADIISQFFILLSSTNPFLGVIVKVLLIIIPIISIILAIKFHKKSIVYIMFILMLWIIYSPMKNYISNHIEEEKSSYNISDYIEYDETFNTNSEFYFEETPETKNYYTTFYNEETLKNECYPITYKVEIKNIINDKEKIKAFKESLENIYGVEDIINASFTSSESNILKEIPFEDNDYNIYLLTCLFRKDSKEGSIDNLNKLTGVDFGISCQDDEIILPKKTYLSSINATSLLNNEEKININETYVNYIFISVPKVYNDYNLHMNGYTFDFKSVLQYFGIQSQ